MIRLKASILVTRLNKHRLILKPEFGASASHDGRVVGLSALFFVSSGSLVTNHRGFSDSDVGLR